MKSTHIYEIVLSFLLAVFLSRPLYSNKKMATCRLALWSVVLRSYLYYKKRRCKGQRKGTVLGLSNGLGGVASLFGNTPVRPWKKSKIHQYQTQNRKIYRIKILNKREKDSWQKRSKLLFNAALPLNYPRKALRGRTQSFVARMNAWMPCHLASRC